MASIQKVKDKYRVQIRKKGIEIQCTFSNLEDAELYAKYKEDLIDNMNAFSPKDTEIVRLKDAICFKIEEAKQECHKHTVNDLHSLHDQFLEFLEMPIKDITKEMLLKKAQEMIETPVYRGGSKKTRGPQIMPSINTIIRRFRILSSVYGYLDTIADGIENIPIKVIRLLENQSVSVGS